MPGHRYAVFLVALLALVSVARAESLEGKVVRISDGDSLTVLVVRERIRVRLLEIAAPEFRQAFGKRSRDSLAELCAGKQAHIEWTSKDQYGRTLGRVWCDGA